MKTKKKILRSGTALVTALLIICLSLVTVFAANEAEYKVNGQTVRTGDTVTYILRFTGLNKKVAGINMYVEYDEKHLSVIKETANLPVFTDAVCNTASAGKVYFNSANAARGYEIDDEAIIISISFKIKDEAGTIPDITSVVEELYDMDVKPVDSSAYQLDGSVIEGTLPDVVTPQDVEKRIEQAKKDSGEDTGTNSINLWIIIGGAAALLCIAAAGIIIIARRNGKKEQTPKDSSADDSETEQKSRNE